VLDVARRLVDMGCREVALIGGEAYLRQDLVEVVRALAARGVRVTMQTGGRAFPAERAARLRDAGMTAIGVSVDGPEDVHDLLRGNAGSHAAALRAIENARAAGMVATANTQINRLSYRRLRETVAPLRARGVEAWQVQLTTPMGHAADRPEWLLEPFRVVAVIDTLAAIQTEALDAWRAAGGVGAPFNVVAGNNIGYFGPHEQLLRSQPLGLEEHWRGCRAGMNVISLESDGTVKPCPSLPTAPYTGGNLRERPIEEIWTDAPEMAFARAETTDELWGFCATCYYAEVCRGGCSWTAHTTLGRRGNNPYCYHRVEELKRRGLRERLELKERAKGEPYDFGRFEIVEEPWIDECDEASAPPRRLPLV
ncbi:MAG TPA: radical SAM protein, partial [Minicystis sp.]|nr:radical SAM protein [Minicystis sp.]